MSDSSASAYPSLSFTNCGPRYGASGVWVGTRFVASVEAGAPRMHKEQVITAGYDDTIRTTIYSGRPLQVRKTKYVEEWRAFIYSIGLSKEIEMYDSHGK